MNKIFCYDSAYEIGTYGHNSEDFHKNGLFFRKTPTTEITVVLLHSKKHINQ